MLSAQTPTQSDGAKETVTMTLVTLTVRRFKPAPPAELKKAEARALEPVRLERALSSPLVEKFARVTHSVNPDIWLFDPATVATEILLPIERFNDIRSQLKATLEPFGLELEIQVHTNSANSLKSEGGEEERVCLVVVNGSTVDERQVRVKELKMFGLYSIEEAITKFIKAGEIGRGRNKTAINKAQQLSRAIATEVKALGV